ncbi:hypothetical protein ABTB22_19445, partial [Acinetobacter baumannii]
DQITASVMSTLRACSAVRRRAIGLQADDVKVHREQYRYAQDHDREKETSHHSFPPGIRRPEFATSSIESRPWFRRSRGVESKLVPSRHR